MSFLIFVCPFFYVSVSFFVLPFVSSFFIILSFHHICSSFHVFVFLFAFRSRYIFVHLRFLPCICHCICVSIFSYHRIVLSYIVHFLVFPISLFFLHFSFPSSFFVLSRCSCFHSFVILVVSSFVPYLCVSFHFLFHAYAFQFLCLSIRWYVIPFFLFHIVVFPFRCVSSMLRVH